MQNDATASTGAIGSTDSNTAQNSIGLIGAAAVGAALMYFLDPQRGNRRRKRMLDRLVHAGHTSADFLGPARRDTANRLRGIAAEAKTILRDDMPEDRVLEERVRAELQRAVE